MIKKYIYIIYIFKNTTILCHTLIFYSSSIRRAKLQNVKLAFTKRAIEIYDLPGIKNPMGNIGACDYR